jgi:hypothetical protein
MLALHCCTNRKDTALQALAPPHLADSWQRNDRLEITAAVLQTRVHVAAEQCRQQRPVLYGLSSIVLREAQ